MLYTMIFTSDSQRDCRLMQVSRDIKKSARVMLPKREKGV